MSSRFSHLGRFSMFLTYSLVAVGASQALAASANLIANPSVETANSANSNLPQSWLQGNWGTNKTTFSYPTTGQDGTRSVTVQITSYSSGDAKWYFTPVAVAAGSKYTFSDYYQSNVANQLVAQYDNGSGKYTYQVLASPALSATWKQVSVSLTVPSGQKNLTIFHLINKVGWLTTDNFSLTSNTSATPPTVSVTAPLANSTVSGSVQLSASATDSLGVSSVQFYVGASKIGSAITVAPYQVAWNTATVANGSYSITAVATNTSSLTTTSTAVPLTVNNPVVPPPTPPSVSITAPTAGSILSGSFQLSATAADNIGVASVQFYVGATKIGSAITVSPVGAPYQVNWNTTTVVNGLYDITAVATNTSNLTTTSLAVQVTVNNVVAPPTVTITAPAANATVNGTAVTVAANPGSSAGVKNVQFMLDGVNLGAPVTASPYQVAWNTTTVTNGGHSLTAFVTANDNQTATSALVAVTVSNQPPPTVIITAPAANATVSGSVLVTANPNSGAGIKNVQFKLDGVNLGAPVTTSYQLSWDTTASANGTHSLTAVVTANDNQTATSVGVSVTVSNQASSNLIKNPSVETVNPSNSALPQFWDKSSWGNNRTSFSYLTSGHSGNRSVMAQITSYSSGAAYWSPNTVAVTAGQTYDYSDYYMSNAPSEVGADLTMSNGNVQYSWIGPVGASPNTWSQFETQLTIPAGVVAITFYHDIYSVGSLALDDVSFTPYTYQGFARPIVTVQFDDGFESFYQNGLPLLQKYGFLSTQFIISGTMDNDSDYMTSAQVKQLYTLGHEIGSHTVTHPDLTTLSFSAMDAELKNSQQTLQNLIGVPVPNFALPYGAYNTQVIADAKLYYNTVRTVQQGFNAKNNFRPYNLLAYEVDVNTPRSDVQAWIQEAIATNTWLILFYHRVDPTISKSSNDYNRYPVDLDADLAYLKSTGVTVETTQQALIEITPQLP